MSICANSYHREVFAPDIHGTKVKTHVVRRWHDLVEPVHYGYGNPEMLLTAAEVMLDSSRTYFHKARWGTYGVTGLLLDSSGVTMQDRGWHVYGTMREVKDKARRLLTIGMLSCHYEAPVWRAEQGIALENKVRLPGPFDEHPGAQEKAWDRLRALSGQRIVPLNDSHPRALRINFTGMAISKRWRRTQEREWCVDFYVQYPREKYGSGWDLSFLCEGQYRPFVNGKKPDPRFDFSFRRGPKETLTVWWNRVADFVESLLLKRGSPQRIEVARKLRSLRKKGGAA